MTTHLRHLKIRAIGLVDKGANPGAFIALFKRDTKPEDRLMADKKTAEELLKAATKRADEAEAVIAKAKEDADAEAAKVAKEAADKAEAEKKAEGDVQKRVADLEKRAEGAETELAKVQEANELREAVAKAGEISDLFGPADEFAPILRKIHKTLNEDERKVWDEKVASGQKIIKEAAHFKEIGAGGQDEGGDEYEKIVKAATDKHADIPVEDAVTKYLETKDGKVAYKVYLKSLTGE